jgi:hypothetical protein
MYPCLIYCLLSSAIDSSIYFFLGLAYHLFNTGWMDAAIKDELV